MLLAKVPKIPWMVVLPGFTIIFGYLAHGDNALSDWDLPTLKSKYGELDTAVAELPKWEVALHYIRTLRWMRTRVMHMRTYFDI